MCCALLTSHLTVSRYRCFVLHRAQQSPGLGGLAAAGGELASAFVKECAAGNASSVLLVISKCKGIHIKWLSRSAWPGAVVQRFVRVGVKSKPYAVRKSKCHFDPELL
jgi:hypothetical protein